MPVRLVWITAPILAPLPIKDRRSNSAVINYVTDALLLSAFSVLANLLYKVCRLVN